MIDFTTGAAKRVALDKCISGERGMSGIRTCLGSTSHCAHEPTLSDLSPLLQILHTHSKAVCLSGMEEYYHHYIDPVKPHAVPKSLQHLRDPGKDGCDLPILFQHCNTLTHLVAVTETQAAAIEAQTRLQHRSSVWYTSRAGRITASNMHAVMSASVEKPATSTVSVVCKKTATSAAIRWGIDNEGTARHYTQQASTKTPVSTELQPSHTKRTKTHTCENMQRLWCICKGPEDLDDMVACDNESCAVQWFHLSCVGLSQAPSETESWLCTSCTH